MKTRLRLLVTLLMAIAMGTQVKAATKEAYAVFSSLEEGKKLTFYYDDKRRSRYNTYSLNPSNDSSPGWYSHVTFEIVEFDSSFKDFRPTTTYSWFSGQNTLKTIIGIDNLKTDNVTNMKYMFSNCKALETLPISGFVTDNVTKMSGMFHSCQKLESLDLSSWNTSNVTDMTSMFGYCEALTNLDVSGWNTENVVCMERMFEFCEQLTYLDVSSWDTSNVTKMDRVFYNCKALTNLDVSGWNTGNVTDMSCLFWCCSQLSTLDVSGWNTSNVTNMERVFFGCTGLTSLDVSGWNTGKVTNMGGLFYCLSSLTSLDVSSFDTSNVTNMEDMFGRCFKITSLDVSGFDTKIVTNMCDMFESCKRITSLDLSGFYTGSVTDMKEMFYYCEDLTTIYVGTGWSTENVTVSDNMFRYCKNLVGGGGTAYNVNYVDKGYARIDGGESSPGYLTSDNVLTYDLTVADTQVTGSNKSDILGNGVFEYSPSSKKLSVKGSYTNTEADHIIQNSINGLTIDVTNDAVLESSIEKRTTVIKQLKGSLVITGNGKVTLKGAIGIDLGRANTSATIDNMTMEIDAYSYGFYSAYSTSKVLVKSSDVTITTNYLASACGSIEFENCSITDPQGVYISGGVTYDSDGYRAESVTITKDSGISTGISEASPQDIVQCSKFKVQSQEWYTIDGRRLNGKPTKKGVYINNGKKAIVD